MVHHTSRSETAHAKIKIQIITLRNFRSRKTNDRATLKTKLIDLAISSSFIVNLRSHFVRKTHHLFAFYPEMSLRYQWFYIFIGTKNWLGTHKNDSKEYRGHSSIRCESKNFCLPDIFMYFTIGVLEIETAREKQTWTVRFPKDQLKLIWYLTTTKNDKFPFRN